MIDVIETNGNLWLGAAEALTAMGFKPHHKGGFGRTLQRVEHPDIILGITSRTAYRKLETEQRCELNRAILGMKPGKPMTAVSESGLYTLIFRNEKPIARHFRSWVTQNTLPSINRTGSYFLGEEFLNKRKSEEDEFVWIAMNVLHDRCSRHID